MSVWRLWQNVDLTAAKQSVVTDLCTEIFDEWNVRMLIFQRRKINIDNCQSDSYRDLCTTDCDRMLIFRWRSGPHFVTESYRSLTVLSVVMLIFRMSQVDKLSTWPPRKINILTVSQSSKISVNVDLTARSTFCHRLNRDLWLTDSQLGCSFFRVGLVDTLSLTHEIFHDWHRR